mmetsp:Transcript_3038/g.4455  ORF Transcript_3038/g.4455 Transcript_3038/m.4455 type:complete len:963 (+) Transcript_3038:76-2964(+)
MVDHSLLKKSKRLPLIKSKIPSATKRQPKKEKKEKEEHISVYVRVRGYTGNEDREDNCFLISEGKTICAQSADLKKTKTFSYDSCFEPHTSQETLYKSFGNSVCKHVFEGYNVSLFAFGQTGSGKSYTIFGTPTAEGILPRLMKQIYTTIEHSKKSQTPRTPRDQVKTFHVNIALFEIYNEQLRDLFNPTSTKLKIREYAKTPFVDGLTTQLCDSYEDMFRYVQEGMKLRTISSTEMNYQSSRAHTIFQVTVTQKMANHSERKSILNIIDLAGSERTYKSNTDGQTLKEGSMINLSLSELGNVINKLAERDAKPKRSSSRSSSRSTSASSTASTSSRHKSRGRTTPRRGTRIPLSPKKVKKDYINYRNSKLTWLLKDSLSGSSKTIMIATVAPFKKHFSESLSTLRYANRAKDIKTHAKINENTNTKLVAALRSEIENLKKELSTRKNNDGLQDQLLHAQSMMSTFQMSESELRNRSKALAQERQRVLEIAGLATKNFHEKLKTTIHLVNLNENVFLEENIVYFIEGSMVSLGSDAHVNIKIPGIQAKHIVFDVNLKESICFMLPLFDIILNGKRIPAREKVQLHTMDRIAIPPNHLFRFVNPFEEAKEPRFDFEKAREEMFEAMLEDGKMAIEKQLEAERHDAQQQIEALKKKKAELLLDLKRSNDHEVRQTEIAVLELECKSLQTRLAAKSVDQIKLKKEAAQQTEKVKLLRSTVSLLQEKIEREAASHEKAQKAYAQQAIEYDILLERVESLRANEKQLEKAAVKQQQKMDKMAKHISSLKQNVKEIEHEKNQMQSRWMNALSNSPPVERIKKTETMETNSVYWNTMGTNVSLKDVNQANQHKNEAVKAWKSDDFSSAVVLFGKAIHVSGGHVPILFIKRGECFLRLKKPLLARRDFSAAIQQRPTTKLLSRALVGRGEALVHLKQYKEAFADYTKANALVPSPTHEHIARSIQANFLS